MAKLGNPKNALWEAFLLAAVVFIFGLLLGVAYESSRVDKITGFYALSEVSLMDTFTLSSVVELNNKSCDELKDINIRFADKIYEEARLLEKYEASGKITDDMRIAHKKYDLLRTILWIDSIKIREKCEDSFSAVVYLYEYETEDLTRKATQNVWSKILFDLKQKRGEDVLLIPIAVDSDLSSLNALIKKFEFSEFPVVVIDETYVIEELASVNDLERYMS